MKKFAVAAALLSAVVATPSFAAEGGEGHVEVRGGLITGNGIDEGTLGLAAGYDFDLGSTAFVGAEVAGDKVLVDGALDRPLADGHRAEVATSVRIFATDDLLEGARSFVEKRPPTYLGR